MEKKVLDIINELASLSFGEERLLALSGDEELVQTHYLNFINEVHHEIYERLAPLMDNAFIAFLWNTTEDGKNFEFSSESNHPSVLCGLTVKNKNTNSLVKILSEKRYFELEESSKNIGECCVKGPQSIAFINDGKYSIAYVPEAFDVAIDTPLRALPYRRALYPALTYGAFWKVSQFESFGEDEQALRYYQKYMSIVAGEEARLFNSRSAECSKMSRI